MKKTLIILLFVAAISTSAPAGQVLEVRARHLIEYSQDNKRQASDDEILKQKVICYMRIEVLKLRVMMVDNSRYYAYNSS
jgi:hypothetical protein